jgi:hypothetical protein
MDVNIISMIICLKKYQYTWEANHEKKISFALGSVS